MIIEAVTTLSDAQYQSLLSLEVLPEQVAFSGTSEAALAALHKHSSNLVRGFALLEAGLPIGLFLLKRPPLSPQWVSADACSLHALQIAVQAQGRGLGKACIGALPELAYRQWPGIRSIQLAVDAHNEKALGLYLGGGWVDDGETYNGRVGLERRLTLTLDKLNR
jgi:ribosomal protein S18 acetylase RimI-like enzyme